MKGYKGDAHGDKHGGVCVGDNVFYEKCWW